MSTVALEAVAALSLAVEYLEEPYRPPSRMAVRGRNGQGYGVGFLLEPKGAFPDLTWMWSDSAEEGWYPLGSLNRRSGLLSLKSPALESELIRRGVDALSAAVVASVWHEHLHVLAIVVRSAYGQMTVHWDQWGAAYRAQERARVEEAAADFTRKLGEHRWE